MTAEQFAYWMQGFAELTGDEPPTPAQWKSIREHLQTVFTKVTPPVDLKSSPAIPYDTQRPFFPSPLQMPEVTCKAASGGTAAQTFC